MLSSKMTMGSGDENAAVFVAEPFGDDFEVDAVAAKEVGRMARFRVGSLTRSRARQATADLLAAPLGRRILLCGRVTREDLLP